MSLASEIIHPDADEGEGDIVHPVEGEDEGEGERDSPPLPKSVISLKDSSSSDSNNTSPSMNSPASNLSPVEEESADSDPMAEVSCHTYSAGTDIDEMILPNVMEEMLAFFEEVADEYEERSRQAGR